jgi:hypothetical protein
VSTWGQTNGIVLLFAVPHRLEAWNGPEMAVLFVVLVLCREMVYLMLG